MNQHRVIFLTSAILVALMTNVLAAQAAPGDSGVVNGADVADFIGSGPVIDRDAMDMAAELQDRNAYLDQDPKSPPRLSPPKGMVASPQPGATDSATASSSNPDQLASKPKKQPGKIGKFFHAAADVLSPNWLINLGLGGDNDTDTGPDNNNNKY